ncbi:MAG: hypothetical protein M3Q03_17250 [Chloroflexota bacterium]|nr:hypothetical protein [Chloroflexota bacterium]
MAGGNKILERDGAGLVGAAGLGQADLPWLTPAVLDRVRYWMAGWRARAEGRA